MITNTNLVHQNHCKIHNLIWYINICGKKYEKGITLLSEANLCDIFNISKCEFFVYVLNLILNDFSVNIIISLFQSLMIIRIITESSVSCDSGLN